MLKSFLENFVENIAEMFGDRCEVVIHDFSKGFDETVIKIVNGHVSGREVGACPTSRLFDSFQSLDAYEQLESPVYFTTTEDGRIFKSCTTVMRNPLGKAIGAVCINYDMTDLIQYQGALHSFLGYPGKEERQEEKHYQNVNEVLEHYLKLAEELVGKPARQMDKPERMQALAFLHEKGILSIAKAHVKLCEFFDISKYTLYSYLDEIKKQNSDASRTAG